MEPLLRFTVGMSSDIVVGWRTKISEDNTQVGLERANIEQLVKVLQ